MPKIQIIVRLIFINCQPKDIRVCATAPANILRGLNILHWESELQAVVLVCRPAGLKTGQLHLLTFSTIWAPLE